MTRDEVKQILIILEVAYPNFTVSVEKKKPTVDLWQRLLEPYTYHQVELAVQSYINTSGSGFAPSVSQIIDMIHKSTELATMTESEAWALVSKAIRRSTYYSAEEFDKLPEDVQKAIGAPSQLQAWATDENYNEGVAMSNFQRAYKIVVNRRLEINRLPQEVQMQIEENHANMLEMKE